MTGSLQIKYSKCPIHLSSNSAVKDIEKREFRGKLLLVGIKGF